MSILTAPRVFLGLPAPAKINLFLHVLGRRSDGYHEIQSVFAPIDLCDTLDFCLRNDGVIERSGDLAGDPADDLAVRAARLLQAHAASTGRPAMAQTLGVTITVEKAIPVGAGLGGGSSDAATTLIALNRLWGLATAARRCWPIWVAAWERTCPFSWGRDPPSWKELGSAAAR